MVVTDLPVAFSFIKVDDGVILKLLGHYFLSPHFFEDLGEFKNQQWAANRIHFGWNCIHDVVQTEQKNLHLQ